MSCDCGQINIPKGENCTIKLYDVGGETSIGTMMHTVVVHVNEGNRFVTYSDISENASFTGNLGKVEIAFNSSKDIAVEGKIRVSVSYNGKRIASQYIGDKDQYRLLPNNKIIMGCSNLLDVADDNARLIVIFESVCVEAPDDCCDNGPFRATLSEAISTLCVATPDETTTTTTPEPVYYMPDCSTGDCIGIFPEDVPVGTNYFSSYPRCKEEIDRICSEEDISVTSTTTTCDPSDPDCTTTPPPTTEAPDASWGLKHTIEHTFSDPSASPNYSLHKDGEQIVIADTQSGTNAGKLAVYRKDVDGCGWTQRGSEIQGVVNNFLGKDLATDASGVAFVASSGDSVVRFEWNESTEEWDNVSTLDLSFPSGNGIEEVDMTPDGRYVAISDFNYDGPGENYGSEYAANECGVIEVHEWNGSSWSQVGQTLFGDVNTNMGMDLNITPDGQHIYFGTRTSRSPQVSKVYNYSGPSWVQKGSTIYPISIPLRPQKMGNDLSITASGDMLISGNDESAANGNIQTMLWNGSDWDNVTQESGQDYIDITVQNSTTTVTSDGKYLFRLKMNNSQNANDNTFEFSRYENIGSGVWANPVSTELSQINTLDYRYAQHWSSEDGHSVVILSINESTNQTKVDVYTDTLSCTTTQAPVTTTPGPTTTPAPTTTTTTIAPPTTTPGPTSTTTTTLEP